MSTATKLREEGRVATLRRLLMKRFGPLPHATEQRLELATPEQLDRYTDRVLDAATLADVFAEPQG